MSRTLAIDVVAETARARALLHPARLALLAELDEPRSAAAVARRLDQPRQRVNYHLRELESQRLVSLVDEQQHGSVVERRYRRTGRGYAISPAALGPVATRPEDVQDRFSAAYLLALAARTLREVGTLQANAEAAAQRLPTLTLDTEVRFASPERRAAFAEALTNLVADLARSFHDEACPDGRTYRLQVGAYPRPQDASLET